MNTSSKVALQCTFEDVWSYLDRNGAISLYTKKSDLEFLAEAKIAIRGPNTGNKFLLFRRDACADRCYEKDWGYHCNSSGTWIGMYCKALDDYISKI